jgi:Family of unknown function (DUF6492)
MKFILLLLAFLYSNPLTAADLSKKTYHLSQEKIDVVIPCHKKDMATLDFCIEGIRQNGENIRRIIVISSERLTDKAEWFDEARFPFNKEMIKAELIKKLRAPHTYIYLGWYYQQLLKFYAPFVIPKISSNVLCLDSDTVFLNPVSFLNEKGGALFNPATEYHRPYFQHMAIFIPKLKRLNAKLSGVAHHMLFQRPILEDLFNTVGKTHNIEFWRAFCRCVPADYVTVSGASEYEIYFNYALTRTHQVEIRRLNWENIPSLDLIPEYKEKGYHYVSAHTWMRQ